MGKIVTVGCGIIVMFMLLGCGARDLSQFDVDIAKSSQSAMINCMKHRKPDLTDVSKEHTAFVLMAWESGERMMSLMGKHPCSQGTNVYDGQIAEVRAKNKALESAGGTVAGLGFAWLGADVLNTALKEAGNVYESSGYSSTYVTNERDSRNTSHRTDDSYNSSNEDSYNSEETFIPTTHTSTYPTTVTNTETYTYPVDNSTHDSSVNSSTIEE